MAEQDRTRWTRLVPSFAAASLMGALGGCTQHRAVDEFTSLRIELAGRPEEIAARGRVWTVDERSAIAVELADLLSRCDRQELVKFRPRYRVVAHRRDGTDVTFLVLHELVKVEGVAFRCERDVERLVERLWVEAGAGGATYERPSGTSPTPPAAATASGAGWPAGDAPRDLGCDVGAPTRTVDECYKWALAIVEHGEDAWTREAKRILDTMCRGGSARACKEAADFVQRGVGGPRDADAEQRYHEMACRLGIAEECAEDARARAKAERQRLLSGCRRAIPQSCRLFPTPRLAAEVAMFVGAYWSQRQESREQAAERISRYLRKLVARDELAAWFLTARKKSAARVPLGLDPPEVASRLRVNRRDVGGDVITELGFSLAVWNGAEASLHVTIGAFSPYVSNSVVLAFEAAAARDPADCRPLLEAAIDAFDPEHAVVTSHELLTRTKAKEAWEVGWLTYGRGGRVVEHAIQG